MTGVEITIGLGVVGEGVKLAILALSEFAIAMGFASILQDIGFSVTYSKEKPDEFSQMKEEILKHPPLYPGHKNNPSFFNYTLSSNIGIYPDENLGDIYFFSEQAKEIFKTSGFKISEKIYNIPEPEPFPNQELKDGANAESKGDSIPITESDTKTNNKVDSIPITENGDLKEEGINKRNKKKNKGKKVNGGKKANRPKRVNRGKGPCGKPKLHFIKFKNKKEAYEAAKHAGKGKPIHHPHPEKGNPHFHPNYNPNDCKGLDEYILKNGVHYEYPK